jgi:hypothetical protein
LSLYGADVKKILETIPKEDQKYISSLFSFLIDDQF